MPTKRKLKIGEIVVSKRFRAIEIINLVGWVPRIIHPYWAKGEGGSLGESRANAHFVVIKIEEKFYTGGHNDAPEKEPCACEVTVKRLNEDGTFNLDGEMLRFYQEYYSGAYGEEVSIDDSDLQITGRLTIPN